ncbi:hypothetical protein [Alicyclobacillus acidocaldarius]|nr:hypothetical protein [Alicyclobacillus acidocaldarius]
MRSRWMGGLLAASLVGLGAIGAICDGAEGPFGVHRQAASVAYRGKEVKAASASTSSDADGVHFSLPFFFGPPVKIVTFGSGIPSSQVTHIQNLLNRVNSIQRIRDFLGVRMNHTATIVLVKNAADYQAELRQLGVSAGDASSLSEDSNGFTLGSTVVIPLFQNPTDVDLANVLTHELTHVDINQHISNIPSWMNEGMAVYMGMNGQKAIENPVDFASDEKQDAEDILQVVQSNQLVPLTGSEAAILSGQETYDYELQDWLAVCYLIAHYGKSSIQTLVRHLESENPNQAFYDTYGETVSAFNAQFTKALKQSASVASAGASLEISISPSYHGEIFVQPPNQAVGHGFKAEPGTHHVTVTASGQVQADLPPVGTKKSKIPATPGTMYVSLLPQRFGSVDGQKLLDAEMEIQIQNGLYTFENAWEELENNPMYDPSYLPEVLGVTITAIHDEAPNDPILTMLNAENA